MQTRYVYACECLVQSVQRDVFSPPKLGNLSVQINGGFSVDGDDYRIKRSLIKSSLINLYFFKIEGK